MLRARYDLFEKALYTSVQRPDATNDSYLNRHDISFEELITKDVKLEEIRAYVMIRQSALSPEDRKRIIMDCQGKLVYRDARKSITLFGSKFYQDLQGSGKSSSRTMTKTFDVNYTEEPDDMASFVAQDMEVDEDILLQNQVDEGDGDAHFIQDFEEQILLTCQDSPELSRDIPRGKGETEGESPWSRFLASSSWRRCKRKRKIWWKEIKRGAQCDDEKKKSGREDRKLHMSKVWTTRAVAQGMPIEQQRRQRQERVHWLVHGRAGED
jgi:hypothetical protein